MDFIDVAWLIAGLVAGAVAESFMGIVGRLRASDGPAPPPPPKAKRMDGPSPPPPPKQ